MKFSRQVLVILNSVYDEEILRELSLNRVLIAGLGRVQLTASLISYVPLLTAFSSLSNYSPQSNQIFFLKCQYDHIIPLYKPPSGFLWLLG